MRQTVTIDTFNFTRAMTELSARVHLPLKDIIKAEVGAVLGACISRTKVIDSNRALARSALQTLHFARKVAYGQPKGKVADGEGWITTGFGQALANGRGDTGFGKHSVWLRTGTPGSGGFQAAYRGGFSKGWHVRNRDWRKLELMVNIYRMELRAAEQNALKSVHLPRQSWVQIADSVGIPLKASPAIAKARAAIASNGVSYQNGQAKEFHDNQKYVVEILNGYPFGLKKKMDRTLASAIAGRAKFFQTNLSKGVFNEVASTLKKYPGIAAIKSQTI
jgi:hypothetical protein